MVSDYTPSPSEIDEALTALKAMRALWRQGDPSRLEPKEKKSLPSFAFGTNSFILAPQISNQVLSCLVDPTDITGLVNNVQISGPSIKFLIDNVRITTAAWACEASCFANNPMPDLQEGLGELEIKAESLRYIVCAGQDLLADSSFNLETWIMRKVSGGFRRAISDAILGGDGVGKPQGLLNPNSGIPICDTALSTPAGAFSWQDAVMLKFEIPTQWHANGSYLMNQRTFALLLTMSDANGRPLLNMMPQGMAGYQLAGSPIIIVSQMPDCAPGATPIAFGHWHEAYTLVNRQATTIIDGPI